MQVLHTLPKFDHPDLIVGTETSDDAGVFRLRPDLAVVNTVDFFTPIVDDPYVFGQIAAANALSDVYAMGGDPKTALNIVCFPNDKMDIEVLGEILKGGADKVKEAGARSVTLVCLVSAPEGIERLHSEHPDVRIVTASIDRGLNERGFIVPGLGDAGDRLYGTK